MSNLLFTEITKLKRSPVGAVLLIFILLPLLLQLVISLGIFSNGKSIGWFDIFATHEFLVNLLLAPTCFAQIAGFIFAREYQENTINYIFISPYSRLRIYITKVFLLFPLILVSLFLSYVLLVSLGMFLTAEQLTGATLLIHVQNLIIIAIWQFALCFVALVPAILLKNSYSSIIVGAGGVAASIMTVLTSVPPKYGSFNPYYFPAHIVSQLTVGNHIPDWVLMRGLLTMLIIFTLCLCVTLYSYTQSDIHSGS
ncbi:ABC transporter permease [Paenibacillus arenosi]|uniref:ABC transporter permease n=1 Tax=Paenibacillus arenosi TaxID=2774142 RepID=A0ABR9B621_9BACL|nr:ABC transporter permease [Paenibacillus arenosi]MBD8500857.1 ABC transporter permease [Paenibacillus arenosi]